MIGGNTLELQQLKYFLEVARSQHMTRSAERLHIAQPSLSQSIKRLEWELGVALFASRGRNIALTEQGVFLRDRLEPILEQLDALPDQLRALNDPERTTLRLHVTAASTVVSEAIIAYRREHDKLNFQFLQGDETSQFDLRVEGRSAVSPTPEGAFRIDEPIYLVVPDAPRFTNLARVNLADFRSAKFICLFAQRQFRLDCDRLCAEAGFVPRIAFESDSPETVRNMIAAHMGVGFWPAFTWGELRGEGMKLLEIEKPACSRSIVIQHGSGRTDNRVVNQFYDFLCEWFSKRANSVMNEKDIAAGTYGIEAETRAVMPGTV